MLMIRKINVLCLIFLYTRQESQVVLYCIIWRVGDSVRERRSEDKVDIYLVPILDLFHF